MPASHSAAQLAQQFHRSLSLAQGDGDLRPPICTSARALHLLE